MAWYWIVLIVYIACGIALIIANWKDSVPWTPLELWLTGILGPAIVVAGLITQFLFETIPGWVRGQK